MRGFIVGLERQIVELQREASELRREVRELRQTLTLNRQSPNDVALREVDELIMRSKLPYELKY